MKKIPVSLKIELVLVILLLISLISSFIIKKFIYTNILTGIVLLDMAYNNHKHLKKKYMTYIYLIFGVLVLLTSAWNIING